MGRGRERSGEIIREGEGINNCMQITKRKRVFSPTYCQPFRTSFACPLYIFKLVSFRSLSFFIPLLSSLFFPLPPFLISPYPFLLLFNASLVVKMQLGNRGMRMISEFVQRNSSLTSLALTCITISYLFRSLSCSPLFFFNFIKRGTKHQYRRDPIFLPDYKN